jgi:hypothetical protein
LGRRGAEIVLGLVSLTIVAGGFVAGLNAGLTYNTFPLMDGSFVPAGYAQLEPFIRNWFENVAAVQFDHRILAMTTVGAVILLWFAGNRATLPSPARHALHALLAIALLQLSLGISTLLLVVPIPLAAAHQAGAVLLLTAAIVLRHRLRTVRATRQFETAATGNAPEAAASSWLLHQHPVALIVRVMADVMVLPFVMRGSGGRRSVVRSRGRRDVHDGRQGDGACGRDQGLHLSSPTPGRLGRCPPIPDVIDLDTRAFIHKREFFTDRI